MDENESGMDLEEYWHYMHNFNKQFKDIFGVNINESTQQTESSANEATEHKAE
jgi:hypothetical protein